MDTRRTPLSRRTRHEAHRAPHCGHFAATCSKNPLVFVRSTREYKPGSIYAKESDVSGAMKRRCRGAIVSITHQMPHVVCREFSP